MNFDDSSMVVAVVFVLALAVLVGSTHEGPPTKGLVAKRTKAPASRGYEESERGGDREIAW